MCVRVCVTCMRARVCTFVCMRACVCVCVCVCARARVRAYVPMLGPGRLGEGRCYKHAFYTPTDGGGRGSNSAGD